MFGKASRKAGASADCNGVDAKSRKDACDATKKAFRVKRKVSYIYKGELTGAFVRSGVFLEYTCLRRCG